MKTVKPERRQSIHIPSLIESDRAVELIKKNTLKSIMSRQHTVIKQYQDELKLDKNQMRRFIEQNTKQHYISKKPKKQQLYFLFKLILNRTQFKTDWRDNLSLFYYKSLLCCRTKCFSRKGAQRNTVADKEKIFNRGK